MRERQSKILIVDDHPLVREWLGALISEQPDLCVCGEADEMAGALRAIASAKPDLVIADLTLKGSSGIELIRAAREQYPDLAIIVLSMHEETTHAERVVRAGANGYVMKSETTKSIVTAIRDVLRGKIHLSDRVTTMFAAKFLNKKVPGPESPINLLSDRELEVFTLLGQGYEAREIAGRLELSPKTVHAYCARIKDKLNLATGTQLLMEAVRWNDGTAPLVSAV
jgi:DNA-binding NarL/FixJ family response regulator